MQQADEGGAGARRILVVDDSATQRLLLSAHLKGWGFEVSEAANGDEALEALRSDLPDLVLTDWMMPGLDGPGLCRAIRSLPGDAYIYILLLTSRTGSSAVSDGLASGADDFLMKPVNPVELKARLASGTRVVAMERRLLQQKRETEAALSELQKLYRAFEADLAAAAALQRAQLPPAHAEVNGCEIGTFCRFAGHVGGDHVGFFPIGEDAIGLFSIDVSGHGVAASLLAIRLAQYFAPRDPENNIALTRWPDGTLGARPPREVLAELNERCHTSLEHDIYFTMAYAIVELESGRVELCQAGHSPAAILSPDGTVRFCEAGGGPPVGLFDGAQFESGELKLHPGERLILYSDGIVEAQAAGHPERMLGAEGFRALLRPLGEEPVTALLPRLSAAIEDYAGENGLDDDVSALVFELRGAAAAEMTGEPGTRRQRHTAPQRTASEQEQAPLQSAGRR
ncbi:MAG: SpoIIE family protein phosphatase [Pseudomonadota bacterium]